MSDSTALSKSSPAETKARLIAIGASAGAIEALTSILPKLPVNYPIPIVVVIHLPPERKSLLAELFTLNCQLGVKEVEDKERLIPGTVYFAPPDYHILLESDLSISLSSEEPVLYSRPSIDLFLESTAEAIGGAVTGVILSGANNDGSQGLRAICDRGGAALVQAPTEAQASTMPRSALAICPEAITLDLAGIATYLTNLGATA